MTAETAETAEPASSFLEGWSTQGYLDEYYGYAEVPPHSRSLLRFLTTSLQRIDRTFASALELGCGPVLIHAAALAPWVERLDMADLQPTNLEAIEAWLGADPTAFDWSTYIAAVLELEGRGEGRASREAVMRQRIRTRAGDITRAQPLGEPASFALLASFFSLEWVIPTIDAWRAHVARFVSMLEPGGWVIMAALHEADGLSIGGRHYGCARITERALRDLLLELDFRPQTIRVELGAPCVEEGQPLHADLFACAQKR